MVAYERNTEEAFPNLAKALTAFVLYFLGRAYYSNWKDYIKPLRYSFYIVLAVTVFSYVTGAGFQEWGGVNTFTGLYFFKTDLAAALSQCLLVFLFKEKRGYTKIEVLTIGVCAIFILLANARIYYLVLVVFFVFAYMHQREIKTGRIVKISPRFIALILLSVGLLIVSMSYVATNTKLGEEYLLINLNDEGGLLSAGNTQGRSVTWANILMFFNNQPLITRFFGYDLVSDANVGGIGFNAHSLYIKLLFSLGYFGCFVFFMLVWAVIMNLNKLSDRRLFYLTIGYMLIFFVGGISYTSIESTQLSWYALFFMGLSISGTRMLSPQNHSNI
uniref:O-antigen ligase family protein n=1 Tax=Prevotella sp. GTC17254 TaxID=3236794 RepID=A0AB33IYX9_9BACT